MNVYFNRHIFRGAKMQLVYSKASRGSRIFSGFVESGTRCQWSFRADLKMCLKVIPTVKESTCEQYHWIGLGIDSLLLPLLAFAWCACCQPDKRFYCFKQQGIIFTCFLLYIYIYTYMKSLHPFYFKVFYWLGIKHFIHHYVEFLK